MADAEKAPKKGMSNLAVRLLTAAVFLPVLFALLYVVPWWGFFALVSVCVAVAASELVTMTMPGARPQQVWGFLASLGVFAVFCFAPGSPALPTTALAVVATGFVVGLIQPDPISTAGARMAWLVAVPFYAGGMLSSLVHLHALPHGGSWVVLACTLAWAGDTGGYFAGRALGKHKLYPKVSPKKTIEGAVGALAGSVVGAVVMHFVALPELPIAHAVCLAVVASALGQAGDLTVSLVKRSADVKDSGWIVPGHGGLLDRIDALVMTAAASWVYTAWFL